MRLIEERQDEDKRLMSDLVMQKLRQTNNSRVLPSQQNSRS